MDELWEISKFIHSNPELAFHEYKAAKIQCDFLEKEGFKVQRKIGNLETAFRAEYTFKPGKNKIAILSEYDALPYLGHACGHNLITCSALGTAIAAAKFMKDNEISGTLVYIGTPAEEDGGGKIILLKEHVFDDIDAVFLLHPTSGITRIAGECMSSVEMEIEYKGKSAHAGSHPEDGVNALDALTLFFSGIGLMRQQIKPNCKITYVVDNGGKTTSLIPDYSKCYCNTYSFNYKDLKVVTEKVKRIAEGMGIATGCQLILKEKPGYAGRIPNQVLCEMAKAELAAINEPVMDGMPFDYGGEDLGDVSRVKPILNLYVTIFDAHKISNHTDQFRELAISNAGYRCIQVGAKTMYRTIMELFLHPEKIEEAKAELAMRLEKE